MELGIRAQRLPGLRQLVECRNQRLGDVPAAVGAEGRGGHRAASTHARSASWSLTPGLCSVERAESTAQGRTAAIASRDVLRPEAAGEHHAADRRAGAFEMLRVTLFPGQIDDGADPLVAAEQHARRARGGRSRARRAARDRRRSRAPRRRRRRREAPSSGASSTRRACRGLSCGQDEADQVRACLDGGVDVILARQAAHLDERARDELERAWHRDPARASTSSRQDRVRSGELGLCRLRARLDRALRDQDPVPRRRGEQPQLGLSVDPEGGEVTRVDPDHGRVERGRALRARRRRAPRRACRGRARRSPSSAAAAASSRSRRISSTASAPASRAVHEVVAASRRSPSREAAARSPRARRAGRPASRRSARRRAPTSRALRPPRSCVRPRRRRRPGGGRPRMASGA